MHKATQMKKCNPRRVKTPPAISAFADSGFVMLQGTTYWTDLFVRHFLFQAEHTIDGDDLLFFVRKKHVKTSSRYLPKFETEVDVFRKDSKKLPIGDPDIDWEETVYLNLVVHQFDYTLTLAICTRTSPKELQVSTAITFMVALTGLPESVFIREIELFL